MPAIKLASLKEGGRDGTLVVVSRDLKRAVEVPSIAPTLQRALEEWDSKAPELGEVYAQLNGGDSAVAFPFQGRPVHSPLPRAYQWCEASVWIAHLERCRRATNRDLPPQLYTDIGMYQGGSDSFVGPRDPMVCPDDNWDADLEAGICIITDDVPMGTPVERAGAHIKLVMLVNDTSLRKIQFPEMAKGLGVLQSKPANAYSPVAVTPAALDENWDGTMLSRPVVVSVRGEVIGTPVGNVDALFTFPELIAHLAKTRNIEAGSIIGAGTVANRDPEVGSACLLEKRAIEILAFGAATTPFLKYGDTVRIEALDRDGQSIFGAIEQTLAPDSSNV
jgi:fumarylacetoacetate (FAA) hydrolase